MWLSEFWPVKSGNQKWDKSNTKSHQTSPSPLFVCQSGHPCVQPWKWLPPICVDQIVTNWHLHPQVVGANPRSVPNPVCWAELPPRSLGCQWGHPCRQRVMKQGGELCCGFYFISDTRGAGVQTGEDWGPIIWDCRFANIYRHNDRGGHRLLLQGTVNAGGQQEQVFARQHFVQHFHRAPWDLGE